jgi:hypothetical protein
MRRAIRFEKRLITTVALGLLLGCDEEPTRHSSEVPEVLGVNHPAHLAATGGEVSNLSLTLPFNGTVSSSQPAFGIIQTGDGRGGSFQIGNPNSSNNAIEVTTNGKSGIALYAYHTGLGRGALITAGNQANTKPALEVNSGSLGGFLDLAAALDVKGFNPNSTVPTANISSSGKGTALNVNHKGTAGAIATFQSGGVNRARISRTGKGYFNGGTQTGGADLAEAFEVEGRMAAYQPGDVLAISASSDRKVEKSSEPYSTRVIGVYASKPGMLLTERHIDASLDDMVPVGVIGVIPTKVTSENGAIRRGDPLVTASTRGHAMLGTDRDRMLGAVLGKALEEFSGPGEGVIKVLVNVR